MKTIFLGSTGNYGKIQRHTYAPKFVSEPLAKNRQKQSFELTFFSQTLAKNCQFSLMDLFSDLFSGKKYDFLFFRTPTGKIRTLSKSCFSPGSSKLPSACSNENDFDSNVLCSCCKNCILSILGITFQFKLFLNVIMFTRNCHKFRDEVITYCGSILPQKLILGYRKCSNALSPSQTKNEQTEFCEVFHEVTGLTYDQNQSFPVTNQTDAYKKPVIILQ